MRVVLDQSVKPALVSVEEAGNLRELSVRAPVGTSSELAGALADARAGVLKDDHVWLESGFLEQAALDANPAASEQFAALVAYAEQHGWTTPDRGRVRAHVEWTSP